jgi:DNA mismatch endonuclease (patch repair protein)
LPGKPDLVFASRSKVIFVHGCFWHQHADRTCRIQRVPKSRTEYWVPKLRANRLRDRKHERELRASGWQSLVIWECEVEEQTGLEARIRGFLGSPGVPKIRRYRVRHS